MRNIYLQVADKANSFTIMEYNKMLNKFPINSQQFVTGWQSHREGFLYLESITVKETQHDDKEPVFKV